MRHNYKELLIWKRSKDLCIEIYKLTDEIPDREKFGLCSQIRRAAVSVPSNIAEGCGRSTNPQLKQFLNIAYGSLAELETQIIIAEELKYTNEDTTEIKREIDELQKMVFTFIKRL